MGPMSLATPGKIQELLPPANIDKHREANEGLIGV
jgi:hypothetical protein